MTPKSTLWKRDDHTIGKHHVLREYLKSWFPILGITNQNLAFYDGFAGPGEYEGGDEGSPIIAMRTLADHYYKDNISGQVSYYFIEANEERFNHLSGVVDRWRPDLPSDSQIEVHNDYFNQWMTRHLDCIDSTHRKLPPSLIMLDPFGISGIPLSTIRRILNHDKTEIYITIMSDFISRFRGTEEFEQHLDSLFGFDDWREGIHIRNHRERTSFFLNMYERQLREAGAKQVLRFDLYRDNKIVYSVFFGSNNWKGAEKMKEAMWRVAPFGDFAFRAGREGQMTLGLTVDFTSLQDQILDRFGDQGEVSVKELERFVGSDQTIYLTSHLRRHCLKPLEESGHIEVVFSPRKARGYPDGTLLRISTKSSHKQTRLI